MQDTIKCANPVCGVDVPCTLRFCPTCFCVARSESGIARIALSNWLTAVFIFIFFISLMISPRAEILQAFSMSLVVAGVMFAWIGNGARLLGLLYLMVAMTLICIMPGHVRPEVIPLAMIIGTVVMVIQSKRAQGRWAALAVLMFATVVAGHFYCSTSVVHPVSEKISSVLERPQNENICMLTHALSPRAFLFFTLGVFLLHGIFKQRTLIYWERLWPRLPIRRSLYREFNFRHRSERFPLIGVVIVCALWMFSLIATVSSAVVEGIWAILYWTFFVICEIVEIVFRSIYYVCRLLLYGSLEALKRIWHGVEYVIHSATWMLLSVGIPLLICCVIVTMSIVASQSAMSTFSGTGQWSTYGWLLGLIASSIGWLRYGEWLIGPNGNLNWLSAEVSSETPLQILTSTASRSKYALDGETADNFFVLYYARKIVAGCAICLLLCDAIGQWVGYGRFRFGLTSMGIGILLFCVLVWLLVDFAYATRKKSSTK